MYIIIQLAENRKQITQTRRDNTINKGGIKIDCWELFPALGQ